MAVKICLTVFLCSIFLTGYISFWIMYLKNDMGTKVIKEGPYRFIRHPLYAADIFSIPGIVAVWLDNGVFFLAWLVIIVASYFIIKIEEQYMLRNFGDEYRIYKSKVPALFPYKGMVKF